MHETFFANNPSFEVSECRYSVIYFLILYIASSSVSMLEFVLYKYFIIINNIYLGVCGLV